uniref:Uncharacterized protein n=1 Tax=Siphoviridae sp. ctuvC1 TaxID=2826507 RepID=A0A8S5LZM2_9CAUD|nr:MAG TPA: hypothetical protein [Siphoviridae sp. ctuvC1]DAR24743.1 MAG TPA: hypothetical protein [Caudoviricetes sp.]
MEFCSPPKMAPLSQKQGTFYILTTNSTKF